MLGVGFLRQGFYGNRRSAVVSVSVAFIAAGTFFCVIVRVCFVFKSSFQFRLSKWSSEHKRCVSSVYWHQISPCIFIPPGEMFTEVRAAHYHSRGAVNVTEGLICSMTSRWSPWQQEVMPREWFDLQLFRKSLQRLTSVFSLNCLFTAVTYRFSNGFRLKLFSGTLWFLFPGFHLLCSSPRNHRVT